MIFQYRGGHVIEIRHLSNSHFRRGGSAVAVRMANRRGRQGRGLAREE